MVMRVYAQAIPYMFIDVPSMHSSLCWLMNRQAADGSLGSYIDVHSRNLYCASRGESIKSELTAYGLMSVVEVERKLESKVWLSHFSHLVILLPDNFPVTSRDCSACLDTRRLTMWSTKASHFSSIKWTAWAVRTHKPWLLMLWLWVVKTKRTSLSTISSP